MSKQRNTHNLLASRHVSRVFGAHCVQLNLPFGVSPESAATRGILRAL